MFQAMIVEDNAIYRYAIRTILRWEDYGFEIAAEALNGKHALELLAEHPVDLILTDISMPEMNGIDFIKAVKQIDPGIHIVALSSYDDFQFVKGALKLGAVDYLLKHELEPDSLRLLLQQMYKRIEEDKQKRVEVNYMHSNLTGLITTLGKRLLLGEIASIKESEEQAAAVQFPISNHPIVVITVVCAPSGQASKLELMFCKLLAELLGSTSENMSYVIVPLSDFKVCVITYFLKEKGETLIFSEAYHAASLILTDQLRANPISSLGISAVGYGIRDLHMLYSQSEDALSHSIYEGSGKILRYDSLPQPVNRSFEGDSLIARVAIAMKNGGLMEVEKQAELLFSYLQVNQPRIPELRQILVDLFALLKFIANEKNVQQAHMKHWHDDLLKAIDLLQPIQQIKGLFLETCRELLSSKTDKPTSRKEIQIVMDYIHTHYAEDITLVKLSKVLCLSTNYLSNLFKQETGIRIIEYLNRHRIERATKLLRDTTLKVYEVAERTGFQDTSYFCKVFKEIEGTTVTDYKRQVEHH